MSHPRFPLLSSTLLALSVAACGGTTTSSSAGTGGTSTTTTTTATGGTTTTTSANGGSGSGGAGTGGVGTGGTGPVSQVTFSYKPAWAGVTAVEVVGGFNLSTDWDPANPLVKLTADAAGKWTGTAMLPAGQYPYVYRVTGDADGAATTQRYAIDGGLSAYVACPMKSPTFSAAAANPCSQLTVPQGAADPLVHVTGKVLYGGQPIAGYLVEIERNEGTMSHHFFANRIDTAADGTFDLTVAAGKYDIEVLYPTFLSKTDADRDPLTLKALRRAISAAFAVGPAVALDAVEVSYPDYAALSPVTTATLPTTFDFTVLAGAKGARAAVYGTATGMGKSIGDPWWASAYGTATTAAFDGTFTTKQATETMVKTGESYFWGTWQELSTTGAAAWTGESMVFPIVWK